jgi:hypothetical protein
MPERATIHHGVTALIPLMLSAGAAMAGEVTLVSDTWESVYPVEVTWGEDAPDGRPVEHFSHVEMA